MMENLVIKYEVVYEKLQMSSWYVFIDTSCITHFAHYGTKYAKAAAFDRQTTKPSPQSCPSVTF